MASPRIKDGAGVADGEANEKYLAYMKAVRLGQQKARAEAKALAAEAAKGTARPSPTPRKTVETGQTSGASAKLARTPPPRGKISTQLKSSGARASAVISSSATLPRSGGQAHSAPQGSLPARLDSPHSDSSDSIDFEIRSIGHVRSVKKPGSAAAAPSQPASDSVAQEIRDLQSVLQKSLAAASAQRGKTPNRGKMGKGDGVMLEADVGFKDGEKSVFSPHGLDDEKEGSSHVDEDPQVVTAAKKIAELEEMAKEIRTPGGTGTDGSRSKSYISASDQLKASLSAYRAGVAASPQDAAHTDSSDVREKVRNQLSQLHDSTAKNDDDDDDGSESLQTPSKSDGPEPAVPWSSNRQQLQAKLKSYQAQVRILTGKKSQGIARRPDDDDADADGMEANGHLQMHSGKAELEVGDGQLLNQDKVQKLQEDNQKVLENIKKMELKKAADGSAGGSAGAMSNPPLQTRTSNKGDSSPYAGVFPRSDDFDETSIGGGTQRSNAKSGQSPRPLKPIASGSHPDDDNEGGYVDEEDALMVAEENLRLAYSYAGYFAIFMMFMALCCFVFGVFMPWGFSSWAISLPLGLASFYFYWKCTPLPVTTDSAVPQSLVCVSIAVVCVSSFLFLSGILSASASLSIAPILGTPLCTGNIPPPVNVSAVPPLIQNATKQTLDNETDADVSDTSNSSRPAVQQVQNASAPRDVHPLSGLDTSTLIKFGGCQGWNMCGGKGIKMLTCSKLKGFNDWNAVFFFFSSFLIPPLWLWIYYVITIRLQEHMAAATNAPVDALDCSLPACYARLKEMMEAPVVEDDHEWDEESNQMNTRPKFNSDGPYSGDKLG